MNRKTIMAGLIYLSFVISALCQVTLPKLISDGMVIQRDSDVKIWGWASADEPITIYFLGKTYSTSANQDGEWEIRLAPQAAGGPVE